MLILITYLIGTNTQPLIAGQLKQFQGISIKNGSLLTIYPPTFEIQLGQPQIFYLMFYVSSLAYYVVLLDIFLCFKVGKTAEEATNVPE